MILLICFQFPKSMNLHAFLLINFCTVAVRLWLLMRSELDSLFSISLLWNLHLNSLWLSLDLWSSGIFLINISNQESTKLHLNWKLWIWCWSKLDFLRRYGLLRCWNVLVNLACYHSIWKIRKLWEKLATLYISKWGFNSSSGLDWCVSDGLITFRMMLSIEKRIW